MEIWDSKHVVVSQPILKRYSLQEGKFEPLNGKVNTFLACFCMIVLMLIVLLMFIRVCSYSFFLFFSSLSLVTLCAKLSGTVYCNQSCLWVCFCVCVFVGLLPR